MANKLDTIHRSLQATACYARKKSFFDQMLEISTRIRKASRRVLVYRNPILQNGQDILEDEEAEVTASSRERSSVLAPVMELVTDDECLEEMKKKNLTGVIGEVATQTGQMAMLVPSANGLLFGASILSVGAVFRVLSNLFSSQFQWDNLKQRRVFISLNCSFYETRQGNVFDNLLLYPDNEIISLKSNLEKNLQRLQTDHNKLTSAENTYQQAVLKDISTFIKTRMAKNEYTLLQILKKHLNSYPATKTTMVNKLNHLIELSPKVLSHISDQSSIPNKTFLIELLNQFTIDKLNAHLQRDKRKLIYTSLEPTLFYLKKAHDHLQSIYSQKLFAFNNFKSNGKKNETILMENENNYLDTNGKLKRAMIYYQTNLDIINAKLKAKRFSGDDDGAHSRFTVMDEYSKIKDLVYGKIGYSFITYFRKELKTAVKSYSKVSKRYNKFFKLPMNKKQKPWACRDLNYLRGLYSKADGAAEVVFDFLATNQAVLHTPFHRYKKIARFIPFKWTKQYRLLRYAHNVYDYKTLIEANKPLPRRGVDKNLKRLWKMRKKRGEVEQLFREYDCTSFL